MSLKQIVLILCIYSFSCLSVKAQSLESFITDYSKTEMYQLKKDHETVWKDVPKDKQKGWKQYKRWEYFWSQRLYPNANLKQAISIYSDVQKQFASKTFDAAQQNTWNIIGPIQQPKAYGIDSKGLGRVNVARFHPTDPNIIWIGTATGGVWKTTDKGATWTNFPFTQFLSLGVSDIAISPQNPDIIYVATGDADGSLGTAGYYSSIGIIKTTDGGKTWSVTNMANELEDRNIISRLIVHPKDSNIVLAATISGIYKTTDGGDTWENKRGGNFRDMELKPDNNNYVYAATSSRSTLNYIFTTDDFGDTWVLRHQEKNAGRIQMAVTPVNPNFIMAVCSNYLHSGLASVIISEDAGETFETTIDSTYGNLLNWGYDLGEMQRGQSYYDLCIALDNKSDGVAVLGGIECHKTTNYGYNWSRCTNTNSSNDIHVDMHDLVFNPLNNELYLCNDGGIYVSKDKGSSWTDLSAGLSITQYYRVGMSATNPNLIICGAQDNGTSMYIDGTWNMVYGGDGMDCAIDPTNDDIVYASVYNGSFVKSKNKGKTSSPMLNEYTLKTRYGSDESGAWIAPFAIDPQKSSTLYACYNNVWKSTNSGDSWTKISAFNNMPITFFAVAPSNSSYLYFVINDDLYMTSDGGGSWKKIFTASNTITSIAVSATNPSLIWFTLSGYSANNKVMMYDGTVFTNLTGNLPNIPINTVVYQKGTKDRVYIGTDIGVFYSENKSNTWDNINANLPHLIISELEIFYGSEIPKLRAATYGRGLWETNVITCPSSSIDLAIKSSLEICPHEFAVIEAAGDYTDYVWSNGSTGKVLTTNREGVYSVSANNGDCKVRSNSVKVTVKSTPAIVATIRSNQPACIGDTLELMASNAFNSYLWSTGETQRIIKITESGQYHVSGQKASAECPSYSDTLVVTFLPKPSKPVFEVHGSRLVATEDSTLKYQWYIDGVAITGAKERIYQVEKAGIYSLLVTNSNNCGSFSDAIQVEPSSVDNNNLMNNITVSPNPSKGEFKIEIKANENDRIEYSVIDYIGKEVATFSSICNSENFITTLNLENEPDGIYMMMIKLNGLSTTVKLIKK